jgi:hypothetical protein
MKDRASLYGVGIGQNPGKQGTSKAPDVDRDAGEKNSGRNREKPCTVVA